jgi:hypothetical protein
LFGRLNNEIVLILEVGAKVLIPTKGSGDMMFNATFKNISVIS